MAEPTHAMTFSLWRIPAWMFARKPELVSLRAADLRYTCPVCGVQEPYVAANGFVRRECWCEYEARQRNGLEQFLAETGKAVAENRTSRTYTWLGDAGASRGLELKSFKGFVPHEHRDALTQATWYAARLTN